MSTQKATVDFILQALGRSRRFSARAMFGEYALYADGKVAALVCDDQLYVKILPASAALDGCERDSPYPGAKPHYVVDEGRLARMEGLGTILLGIAAALPAKKLRTKTVGKPKPSKKKAP